MTNRGPDDEPDIDLSFGIGVSRLLILLAALSRAWSISFERDSGSGF
jgi:hypothetical protein